MSQGRTVGTQAVTRSISGKVKSVIIWVDGDNLKDLKDSKDFKVFKVFKDFKVFKVLKVLMTFRLVDVGEGAVYFATQLADGVLVGGDVVGH